MVLDICLSASVRSSTKINVSVTSCKELEYSTKHHLETTYRKIGFRNDV